MFFPLKTLSGSLLIIFILGCFLFGCKGSVPNENTSLVLDPGSDPGKPSSRISMVWHHHSTGDSILQGGLLEALKANNVDFYDINYEEAKVGDYVIGDHTDPVDFPKNFNTSNYFDTIKSWELKGGKKQHDIIMFKSCYPASNIVDEAMFENYKKWYLSLLPTFQQHPEILFIAMSTPPQIKAKTTPENAARARRWAKWITKEYARDLKNVKVFDLFNALAILEGKPDQNTLVPQFSVGRKDSHPSKQGGQAVTRLFIPWFNRIIREAGLVK